MLQALRKDHIWDVRITLASFETQALFQPVAVDRRRRAQRCAGKRASVGFPCRLQWGYKRPAWQQRKSAPRCVPSCTGGESVDNANMSSMTCGTDPSQLFLQLQRIHELFHGVHNVKDNIGALLTLLFIEGL